MCGNPQVQCTRNSISYVGPGLKRRSHYDDDRLKFVVKAAATNPQSMVN